MIHTWMAQFMCRDDYAGGSSPFSFCGMLSNRRIWGNRLEGIRNLRQLETYQHINNYIIITTTVCSNVFQNLCMHP